MSMNLPAYKKRYHKRKFEYFEPDTVPMNSSVTVIEVLKKTSKQNTTIYVIRYPCCGAEAEMAHKSIRNRQAKGIKMCIYCRNKAFKADLIQKKHDDFRESMKSDAWGAPNPAHVGRHMLWSDHMCLQVAD